MVSRRSFLLVSGKVIALAGLLSVGARASYAVAQGRGNDRGNGNSDGNGKGNGNSGGNGGGGGNEAGGKSKDSHGGGNSDQSEGNANGNAGGRSAKGLSSLGVRHRTGIVETISQGRYIMRDKWGRVIIDRRATTADRERLRSLID